MGVDRIKVTWLGRTKYRTGRLSLCLALGLGVISCTSKPSVGESTPLPSWRLAGERPSFSADSAYALIQAQLRFGPRIPGTPTHRACGDWLVAQLKRYGGRVYEQKGTYKGTPVRNILASFGPDTAGGRILLSAHWDSRPWADQDPATAQQPVPGANDGASGVAVLLELARLMAQRPLPYPVDIAFWDAEDLGREGVENSFCLGSQYWISSPAPYPVQAYAWGINLDMVGGRQATFLQEGYSRQYAPRLVELWWEVARRLGYERFFPPLAGDAIIDDPYYLSVKAGLPMVNIIQRDPTGRGFFPEWHTVRDDLEGIDRATLQAVGDVLVAFLYSFSPQDLRPQ